MSLILDALRKSEAERRRGQAPDLYAELPPLVPRAAARRPAWPWWLAGGLAVLATLWMLRDVQSLAGATTAPTADAAAPIAAPAPETAPASIPAQRPAAMPAAVAPAMPATTAVIAPIAPNPAPAPAVPEPVATAATPAAITTAEPSPAPPAPASDPILVPPQPSPAQVASASPTPATAPLPASTPTAPAPLRLADLSAGEREQLPALKISMHMWGPTPDQRFAIIDGARVGQGDRVGDAVVEEIGADSVVLSWHGQRLALPIR
jgi:general secretion pathway protein B